MAGVKGRSGGARPNSGPKRKTEAQLLEEMKELDKQIALRSHERVKPIQEALVKDKEIVPTTSVDRPLSADERAALLEERREALSAVFPPGPVDPMAFLEAVMTNPLLHADLRVKSAMKLIDFKYAKPGDKGKKEEGMDLARETASRSKFSSAAPPRLVSNGE